MFRETVQNVFSSFEILEEGFSQSFTELLEALYSGRTRSSGEPLLGYVADVLARLSELNLDFPTMAAACLWPALNLPVSETDVFARFDREIRDLCERICQIDQIDFKVTSELQAENSRNMILALAKDIRVVFILLADRVHSLDLMDRYPSTNPGRDASVCREIFAPLANRMGIGKFKLQLEDGSFRILEPALFDRIEKQIQGGRADREIYLEKVKTAVMSELNREGIGATISGRVKHRYSIYRKMIKQHISFDEVYDVLGIRIITDSVRNCYSILGIIHSLWKPIPHRFKDYIATPKGNMYQSIHTSVDGPSGYPLEVQIRTYEMDRVAEIGIAAHWRYKDVISKKHEKKFAWLHQIMQWIQQKGDPEQLMEMLRVDFFPDEVYVFTPKGDVKTLPAGSTVVDFAFQIHSDVGCRCKGGRVNRKLVPLKTVLQTGDVVEIITSPHTHPNADWMQFVKTPAARSKIRRYIREQNKEQATQTGRELFFKAMRRQKLRSKSVLESEEMVQTVSKLGYSNAAELMAAVGFGEINVQQIINRLKILMVKTEQKIQKQQIKPETSRTWVTVDNMPNVLLKFARCCEPLPGEAIIGYITQGRGITIHATRCANIHKMERDRIVHADWEPKDRPVYPVRIGFASHNHPQLLQDVAKILNAHNALVLSQKTETSRRKDKVRGELVVEISELEVLNRILSELDQISGMIRVERLLSR
ncbi:bifunctional (p)ppGpp synthetase/guanosine-3',5'-bis(diphosphate) 3'-pyrophosphohydrolase [bacterium]|nr:bifunctional (p)ppGpp synthetase/guanosine-3',5'-bis(diphosphate) 3'-pyrophosphohydrolase [candidate division CSSED10-310 bacterium]